MLLVSLGIPLLSGTGGGLWEDGKGERSGSRAFSLQLLGLWFAYALRALSPKIQKSFEALGLHSVVLHRSRMKTVPHSGDCCMSRRVRCYGRLWAV